MTAPAYTQTAPGKTRSAVAVLLLSIVTLGIYWLVYVYKTTGEINRAGGNGVAPVVNLLLAIIIGFVPPFLLASAAGELRRQRGLEPRVSGLTGLWQLLPLIGVIVFVVKLQGALNDLWTGRG